MLLGDIEEELFGDEVDADKHLFGEEKEGKKEEGKKYKRALSPASS